MNAGDYWKAFLDSGIPEYYLMFCNARKVEESNVFDYTSAGDSRISIQ